MDQQKKKIVLTPEILGGFVNSILRKRYDNATDLEPFHYDWWKYCCSKDPLVAIAAPRGHSKSTTITHAYTLASVLFRVSRYALIISDTEGQAVNFLNDIKSELQENDDIRNLFGIRSGKFETDRETMIVVEFDDGERFRIEVKGAEQKVRGLKWDGKRPDLIVIDDVENDEIVLNDDRREKFRKWFYSALLPCRAPDAKVRLVGTVLHMDSLLERLLPKPWDKRSTITPLLTYQEKPLGGWKGYRYRAHDPDYSHILWPSRWPREKLKEEYEIRAAQGFPEVYAQEFLNYPLDESSSYFRRSDFLERSEEDENKNLNYYVTCDLAISENDRADYSVFVVGGVDSDGVLHIVDVIRERFDALEIVDTLLQLQRVYDPQMVGIESGAIQKAIGPFLKQEMIKQGVFLTICELVPSKDKQTRARSIQARMRAKSVKFQKSEDWFQTLENEMVRFPRDLHDDQVDAMAWLGLMLDKLVEANTPQEDEDEEYEEEMAESAYYDGGRNRYTGY